MLQSLCFIGVTRASGWISPAADPPPHPIPRAIVSSFTTLAALMGERSQPFQLNNKV